MNVVEIINSFGSAKAFGEAIGKNPVRAAEMRARGSIPSHYWKALVAAAAERKIEGVTLETLADAHAPQPERSA